MPLGSDKSIMLWTLPGRGDMLWQISNVASRLSTLNSALQGSAIWEAKIRRNASAMSFEDGMKDHG
jgi:hypothetical protein